MSFKLAITVAAAACLILACSIEARQLSYDAHHEEGHSPSAAGRRPHPATAERALSHKQARVFPGAVAIKKLVLLKFKKVIPISLILLKSSNENEAELVPVYPTSELPADVQFIPTPNGISGHEDVQAIAIPKELHAQLQANGLANIENIEALLNQAEEEKEDEQPIAVPVEEQLLNIKEDDVEQLLGAAAASAAAAEEKAQKASAASTLRRLAVDEFRKPYLKTSARTSVEEIPLFLYSAKDGVQLVHAGRKTERKHAGLRRYHA